MKLGFIGFGNMASAIAGSVLANSLVSPQEIYLFEPDTEKQIRARNDGMNICKNAADAVLSSDMTILAVKPQIMPAILKEISAHCENKALLSIAAGISTGFIKSCLSGNAYVIRVMPNTPMMLGCGATVVAKSENVPQKYMELAHQIFSVAGIVEYLEEDKLNEVVGVNGSSPAYFFRMAQNMADAAQEQGIDREVALRLIAKTMEGASKMLLDSGRSPTELEKQVSSPSGTTLAALSAFDELGFADILSQAMRRCTKRAYELSK